MGNGFSTSDSAQQEESLFEQERRESFERFPDRRDLRPWWRTPPSQWLLRWFSSVVCKCGPSRVLMLGLDNAGKTTILYKLRLMETVTTIPTTGLNVETVLFPGGLELAVWDVGGQERIRPLWRYYYAGTLLTVFVVDAADLTRLDEAREALHFVLSSDEMRDACTLVYANKQDLEHALDAEELVDWLEMHDLPNSRWHVQPCSGTSGHGLYPGLEWCVQALRTGTERPAPDMRTRARVVVHLSCSPSMSDGCVILSGRLLSGEEVLRDFDISLYETWRKVQVAIACLVRVPPRRIDLVLPSGDLVKEPQFALSNFCSNGLLWHRGDSSGTVEGP